MPTPRFTAFALSAALLLTASACDDDPTQPGDGDARLNVLLTDAPGDVAAAWLQIDRVYLQGGDERVELLTEPTDLIEVTELVGTAVPLVEDFGLEPGTYGQLRFVIGGAVLESEDGTVYVLGDVAHPDGLEAGGDLHCPSCQQSGIKVTLPGDELELGDGETTVTLDFDVSQSFGHRAGNSGRWIMRPVIHGTWIEGGPVLGPGVRGQVNFATGVAVPACPAGTARSVEDFVPQATATTLVDGDGLALVRTGVTAADGTFVLGPLAADTWDLGFLATLELEGADLLFEASASPTQAVIVDSDVTGVTYTVTAATCVPTG
ncbi:MAG: DUF4382 domain-containing protein [Gemmatimonadetes bacterium]|nr:DUF4382 domain-containing protein [Gemmatimonadota bacterium]NNF39327.1 DUF4382 domain-containing protein [Gemmatimonadota bacterium]